MKTTYGIFGILAVLAALLIVSTVSAVPYTQEQQYMEQQGVAQKTLEKVRQYMNSPTYLQMRQIIDTHLSASDQEYIRSEVIQYLDDAGIPLSSSDPIFDLLVSIAEVVMLLLGHNLIGETAAFLITALVAIPFSIGVGIVSGVADVLTIVYALLFSIPWDQVIIDFGLLGAFIIAAGLVVFGLIATVVGIALGCILESSTLWISYVADMFDYLFNHMARTSQNQALAKAIQNQPVIGESLNNFCLKKYGVKLSV